MRCRRFAPIGLFQLAVIACLAALVGCEAGTVNTSDEARLSLAGAAEIHLAPGETTDLAWILVRQSSGPEAGHIIGFTVVSAATDHGCSLEQSSGVTNDAGLAGTVFTAGPASLATPVQVMGALDSLDPTEVPPPPVAFTIHIDDSLRVLRPEPSDQTRYDGLTEGRVQLAVRASSDENRPLTSETIEWEILSGGSGGARVLQPATVTDVRGVAFGEIQCGSTPTTMTVRATLDGTAPVEFTISVTEWGSCDDTHPCPIGWTCESGSCVEPTPDCTTDDQCGEGYRCRFGECVLSASGDGCKVDADCDDGETCVAGECTGCEEVGCPCETLDDCPEGFDCVDGECVCDGPDCGGDPPGCEIVDPDLAGYWDVDSTLHLRESLPDWLDDLLGSLGPIFRFLGDGILGGFDFDIPIIGDALEDAADSLVDSYIPPWVGELMSAIADINDILSTFRVMMDLNLWGAGVADEYNGTLEWREVEMSWRGDVVRGRMVDITGFDAYADTAIEAEAICGTFYIHRHDVRIAFGTIVRWILDVIVTAVSDGEYFTLEELLLDLTYYCDDLAYAIDDLAWDLADGLGISLPDVYDIALSACEAGIEAGTAMALDYLEDIMVSADAMTLEGHSPIVSPTLLEPGEWDGTLFGSDFSGEFTAEQP